MDLTIILGIPDLIIIIDIFGKVLKILCEKQSNKGAASLDLLLADATTIKRQLASKRSFIFRITELRI